ncbi:unnamed protein product [[Candida] boidinii]|uniref:Unnamed protein product n=1 Tax=Candida boidinii TaxID=5477 RepID=A0ACB5UCL7_CANBO|nr:unnamed protein product [[Candida] boidinii]
MENGVPVAERARALSEVLSKNSEYKPDSMYYLEKQIFAPVERLLEKIEGSDVVRLANSLGLDSKRYEARARFNSSNTSNELQPLESTISDSERFRESKFLKLNCSCGASFKFGGLMASGEYQIVGYTVMNVELPLDKYQFMVEDVLVYQVKHMVVKV